MRVDTNLGTHKWRTIRRSYWSNIKVATTKADSNHIRFIVTTIDTSHIKVAIIGVDNNKSTNKCTSINKGTRNSTIIDFEHNRKSTFDSI
jgi:hypothetical protein